MKQGMYGNIPREEIPWSPRIEMNRCTGCGICVSFCHKGVYREADGRAEVAAPYECVISCTGCMSQCPSQAISFPSLIELRDALKSLRAKYGREMK